MSGSVHAILISAPDCHLCAHARAVLELMSRSGIRFDVEERDWDDPVCLPLIERDRIPFPPALYVDGELWGYGRISERALYKRLDSHDLHTESLG